ncbi:hypothetical protein EVG20_g4807 [Dentipellis fragilis]|uniref:Uncharacterized protein n=1 Tax=Dentipellis fragilis TaxID=205917 RepID=A0A4Y9YX01_9AGAM|nr:hypothetical protein EVG20_g4807 [Dentipellis fragilis]
MYLIFLVYKAPRIPQSTSNSTTHSSSLASSEPLFTLHSTLFTLSSRASPRHHNLASRRCRFKILARERSCQPRSSSPQIVMAFSKIARNWPKLPLGNRYPGVGLYERISPYCATFRRWNRPRNSRCSLHIPDFSSAGSSWARKQQVAQRAQSLLMILHGCLAGAPLRSRSTLVVRSRTTRQSTHICTRMATSRASCERLTGAGPIQPVRQPATVDGGTAQTMSTVGAAILDACHSGAMLDLDHHHCHFPIKRTKSHRPCILQGQDPCPLVHSGFEGHHRFRRRRNAKVMRGKNPFTCGPKCQHAPHLGAIIISISSCMDHEVTWEDRACKGAAMTVVPSLVRCAKFHTRSTGSSRPNTRQPDESWPSTSSKLKKKLRALKRLRDFE